MSATTETNRVAAQARGRARTALLAILLALLATVALCLLAATLWPSELDASLGHLSPGLALILGVASAVGVVALPVLGAMGRTGAIVLAVPVVVFSVSDALRDTDYPGAPTGTGLDVLLALMIPAGYFILLFGALRTAGRSRRGSPMVAVFAAAATAILYAVPSGPLTDVEMSSRMVQHGLFIVGVGVAALATLIEFARRPARQSSSRESRK